MLEGITRKTQEIAEDIKVKYLRTAHARTQIAIVEVSPAAAERLVLLRMIKVSWIEECSIRRWKKKE